MPFTFGVGEGRFAARLPGSPPPADFAPRSAALRRSWTAIAATGDPGWARYEPAGRTTRLWSAEPRDVPYPVGTYALWEHA